MMMRFGLSPRSAYGHIKTEAGAKSRVAEIERVSVLTSPKKPRTPSIQGADAFERAWGEPFKSRTIALQHSPRVVGKAGQ